MMYVKGAYVIIVFFIMSMVGYTITYTYFTFHYSDRLYHACHLSNKLGKDALKMAIEGKNKCCHFSDILTIIDYSLPSSSKRFIVLDLRHEKLLSHTYVAHGKNSGELYATQFSNENESKMSSLGFYKTGETYCGKHGYSLRLHGLEDGVNDLAYLRNIVIHPADYVSESYLKQYGRLGRSHGCPALPVNESRAIIDQIKGGTCLFIYSKDKGYKYQSVII